MSRHVNCDLHASKTLSRRETVSFGIAERDNSNGHEDFWINSRDHLQWHDGVVTMPVHWRKRDKNWQMDIARLMAKEGLNWQMDIARLSATERRREERTLSYQPLAKESQIERSENSDSVCNAYGRSAMMKKIRQRCIGSAMDVFL